MKTTISTSLLMAAALACGCASKKPEAPLPPPPSAMQAEALKASILELNKNAKVGTVTAVLPDEALAMIGEVDVANLRRGDVFSIIDGSSAVVAHGSVIEVLEGKVAVRYDSTVRAPLVGDVAVKF